VAAALIDREIGLRHFTDEGVRRRDILALAARVECSVDDAIERDWSRGVSPTALVVEAGNVSFQQRVDLPSGHPQVPMTPQARRAKLTDCLATGGPNWPRDSADRLTALVANVATLRHARTLALAMQAQS
jgi:2-methylcitrate dehydratase PrpD